MYSYILFLRYVMLQIKVLKAYIAIDQVMKLSEISLTEIKALYIKNHV